MRVCMGLSNMETYASQPISPAALRPPAIENKAPPTHRHETTDDLIEFNRCHATSHSNVECLATRAVEDDGQLFAPHRILGRDRRERWSRLRKRRGLADQ